jgi:type II secretory pathway component GspD/PulD (secretin)
VLPCPVLQKWRQPLQERQLTLREMGQNVRVESSQRVEGELLFGGAILRTRNYRTLMSVKDGETLLLGGIIQREDSEVERKVPFLGDIPLLGWLFKKKDKVSRDVELMVFLRPTVTRSPEDVRRLMKSERKRTPRIQEWRKNLDDEAAEEVARLEEEARQEEEDQE